MNDNIFIMYKTLNEFLKNKYHGLLEKYTGRKFKKVNFYHK